MLYQLQRETNARILLIYIFIMQMYKMLKLALYAYYELIKISYHKLQCLCNNVYKGTQTAS